jgi:hypothetical protein
MRGFLPYRVPIGKARLGSTAVASVSNLRSLQQAGSGQSKKGGGAHVRTFASSLRPTISHSCGSTLDD